jgi:hypothetical protein
LRLSGDGGAADGVRCSRGLGRIPYTMTQSKPPDLVERESQPSEYEKKLVREWHVGVAWAGFAPNRQASELWFEHYDGECDQDERKKNDRHDPCC